MAELRITFRLPLADSPRFVLVTDYGLRGGKIMLQEDLLDEVRSEAALEGGVSGTLWHRNRPYRWHLRGSHPEDVCLRLDGIEVPTEAKLRAPISRSAWMHAIVALVGSVFGLVASGIYVVRSEVTHDPWALKMAIHMAAWHFLLTIALFPLSVWGQRTGIRMVQVTSLVFFAIHLGIAISNALVGQGIAQGTALAVLNGASGLAFALAVVVGQCAYRDMEPRSEVSITASA